MNSSEILIQIQRTLYEGMRIPKTNILNDIILFSNTDINRFVTDTTSKLSELVKAAEDSLKNISVVTNNLDTVKVALDLAFAIDCIGYLKILSDKIQEHTNNQQPVLFGGLRRYFGVTSFEEDFANELFSDYIDTLESVRMDMQEMHRRANNIVADKDNTPSVELVYLMIMDNGKYKFERTEKVYEQLKSAVFGAPVAETPVQEGKTKKNKEAVGMDFVSLHLHYTNFYESIRRKDDASVNKLSAILSNPDLREILGLKAMRYNPMTLTHKIDEAMSSPKFNRGYYQKKLKESLDDGAQRLEHFKKSSALTKHFTEDIQQTKADGTVEIVRVIR